MGWVWYDYLAFTLFWVALVGIAVYAHIADERDASEEILWCSVCEENLPAVHVPHDVA